MKWGRAQVRVWLADDEREVSARCFVMTIEDDGPGIPEGKAREALKRGRGWTKRNPGLVWVWRSFPTSFPNMAAHLSAGTFGTWRAASLCNCEKLHDSGTN
jgi:hypothetical protein